MRKLENYVGKYGPVAGPKLFHLLQSQAAHSGVGVRLRKKIAAMEGRPVVEAKSREEALPLFPAERELAAC